MKIALASVNKLFAISELITRHSQYWLPCIYVSFSSVYLLQALVSKRHNGKGRPELHSRSKFANLTGTLDGVERSVLYERAVDHGRGRDIYGYNASGTASPLAHLACASRTRGVRIDCRRPLPIWSEAEGCISSDCCCARPTETYSKRSIPGFDLVSVLAYSSTSVAR